MLTWEKVVGIELPQDARIYTPRECQALSGSLFVLHPHRSAEMSIAIPNGIKDRKKKMQLNSCLNFPN
jgi:hypothetical protein